MIAPFLLIISLGRLIYGALVTGGIYVPIRSKILIEDEGRAAWCKVEGFTKILWGLDLAVFAMYYEKIVLPTLCLVIFLGLTLYTIYITYKNNEKYLK